MDLRSSYRHTSGVLPNQQHLMSRHPQAGSPGGMAAHVGGMGHHQVNGHVAAPKNTVQLLAQHNEEIWVRLGKFCSL